MPGLVGGYGNYFLPVQCGAPDYFKYLNKLFTQFSFNNYIHSESNPIYNSQDIKHKTSDRFNIGSYLAGLFEGDGHINLSKTINSKGKISYPYIAITFFNKDLPLVNRLIELYGGRIRFKNKENAIVWIVNAHEDLIRLINLMNSYLRTPKLTQFNYLISWLNQRHQYIIPIHSLDISDLSSNNWLAGFIDADGSFRIRYTKKNLVKSIGLSPQRMTKERIEVSFRLEQRKVLPYNDQSYEPIMTNIKSFFEILTELRTSKHNKDKTYWIIEVTSLNRLCFLISYLDNHPLLTAKRNDYDDWLKAYKLIKDGKHLTENGKESIKGIKYNMNRKREIFNWDHLIYLNQV